MNDNHKIASMGDNMPPSDLDIVKSRLAEKERGLREAFNRLKASPLPAIINDRAESGLETERVKNITRLVSAVNDAHGEIKKPYLECGQAADAWKRGIVAELDAYKVQAQKPLFAYLEREEQAERARLLEVARVQREEAEKLALQALAHQQANLTEAAGDLLDEAVKSEATANRIESNVEQSRNGDLATARSLQGSSASRKMEWVGQVTNKAALDLNVLRNYFDDDSIQKALNRFVKNGGRECPGAVISEQATKLNIR